MSNWYKTTKGKAYSKAYTKKWKAENPDRVRIYTRRYAKKLYPERELRRKMKGVDSLLDLTKGRCRWEACNDNNPKIYAMGLCRNCNARLKSTPNWPQVKEFYGAAIEL